jgi:hypothetical protein
MFGLMRAKSCSMTTAEKHFRRLHYCGTCKTIGSLYGQKARFLLNHDTIFLAEILTSLSGENVENWQRAYQSYNCLSLPETARMPVPLEFAATANLVLAEFKIADQIADENSRAGKLARKSFSKNFEQARWKLKEWKFPFERIQEILSAQETLERESLQSEESAERILAKLSSPTAETTALFFGEGVRLIGKSELENPASDLGFEFGRLIYLIDAFEDYEKDFRRGQFNAIRAAFRLNEAKLSGELRRKIAGVLRELENEIVEKIYELPFSDAKKEIFAARLRQNLARKLEIKLPVYQSAKVCRRSAKPLTWKERLAKAKSKANELTADYSWAKALPIFIFVSALAFVAPAQVKQAKSWQECAGLGFNLMFLGALFGSVLSWPPLAAIQGLSHGFEKAEKAEEKRRRFCDWCDCDCCCCCDCCNCGGGGDNNCDCGCDGCCCDCNCD